VTASIRVLVVDDEPHARRGLAKLIAATPRFTVCGEAANGEQAKTIIEAGGIDLVMLDVQMPGMSGLDVVRAVGVDRMPAVVFVTAYDAYALRAFDLAAVDYVLKPFKDERLAEALERARAAVMSKQYRVELERLFDALDGGARIATSPTVTPRFVVIARGKKSIVSAREVEWISGANYYSRLHVGDRVFLVREALHAIEKRLPASSFLRVHRSAIVRSDSIREVRRLETGAMVVVLSSGARVRLSRSYRAGVAQLLKQAVHE
jgi:two-component system, LytTR family, response regulator